MVNKWQNCLYCDNSFYTCKNKRTNEYGIKKQWYGDNECVCEYGSCDDENIDCY